MKIFKILDIGDKILRFVMWLMGQKKSEKEPLKPVETEKDR